MPKQHPDPMEYAPISQAIVMFIALIACVVLFTLAGCANTGAQYRPHVDLRGKMQLEYEHDLYECQKYAAQLAGGGQSAAIGAAVGAIAGSFFMAVLGGNRYDRNQGAMVGALSGGTGGGVQGETDQRNVIRRYLDGRGYNVLQ